MDLPAFSRGQPLAAAELNRLAAQIRANAITSVVGGSFQRTNGGTSIIIPSTEGGGGGGGAGTDEFPFQLFNAGDSVKINLNSFLFRDSGGDTVTIGNLGAFYCIPTEGQQIILDIPIDVYGVPGESTLKCGGWQQIWPTYTNPVQRNAETKIQEKLIIPIGEVSSVDDTRDGFIFKNGNNEMKVIQMVKTDLCCFFSQVRGLPAVLAMPWYRKNQVQ
jgi:hypothetical protein